MAYKQGKESTEESSSQGSQSEHCETVKSSLVSLTNAFRSHLKERDSIEQRNELERYLVEGCEDGNENFDVLAWWKANAARFPILSCVARDVLATLVSTVASKSAFGIGGEC
ncbi:hypothetical protein L6164_001283 [Bauhinia variegata]|uniref:Uncharacterized protein n=1 Tax=Bauhinia variegata TaxID=167791 RepID=A0ACB9Q9D0_BAUVA|nr:hypothetical protein L6164_001283 [Bauhinia variegata]